MKKHFITLETYIFGSQRQLIIETDHAKEEIENDWELRTALINQELIRLSNPQDSIEEFWR